MKRIVSILSILTLLVGSASAQTLSFGFGDVELDATLNDLNATAKVDAGGFSTEITVQWGVSSAQVTATLAQGLAPAEVYVAAFLAQASGKPIETVVTQYRANKAAGWGAVAKSLGIKPGSPAFKALKDKGKASATKMKGKKK